MLQNKSEQKKPSLLLLGYGFFLLLTPLWISMAFVIKLKTLDCIDITNKMYMLLGVNFIYAYIVKYYFDIVWRKNG